MYYLISKESLNQLKNETYNNKSYLSFLPNEILGTVIEYVKMRPVHSTIKDNINWKEYNFPIQCYLENIAGEWKEKYCISWQNRNSIKIENDELCDKKFEEIYYADIQQEGKRTKWYFFVKLKSGCYVYLKANYNMELLENGIADSRCGGGTIIFTTSFDSIWYYELNNKIKKKIMNRNNIFEHMH